MRDEKKSGEMIDGGLGLFLSFWKGLSFSLSPLS